MRALGSSPSSGEYEVLRALYLARGHDGNYVDPARLKRHFPTRMSTSTITTVLSGLVGANVQTSGGKYRLTGAGVARSRTHRPRKYLQVT